MSKLSEIRSLLFITDPDPGSRSWFFLPILDLGVIKAPDLLRGHLKTRCLWLLFFFVQPCPVFRIQEPVPFWPLDPFFSGSRIPNLYFWELIDNFLGKKFYNSLWISPHFFLHQFKNKIIFNFVIFQFIFVAAKKGRTTIFFHPSFFVAIFGSGIRDPGSGLNIPDPQHWHCRGLATFWWWSGSDFLFLTPIRIQILITSGRLSSTPLIPFEGL